VSKDHRIRSQVAARQPLRDLIRIGALLTFPFYLSPCYSLENSELTLEQLLNIEVTLTANQPTAVKALPSVVSLITREEIEASGARDMVDILKMVPGFWFHADINGIKTLSFRGIYGYEGKVLVLLDDIEVHDLQFGGVQFGSHYPAGLIESVEIIRGPGSVTYGGTAELAVIRINTRQSESDSNSMQLNTTLTEQGGQYFDLSSHLKFAGDNWQLNLNAYHGKNAVSESLYISQAGDSHNMEDNSAIASNLLSISGFYHQWRYQLLYDDYDFEDRTFFGDLGVLIPPDFSLLDQNMKLSFERASLKLSRDWSVSEHWQIETSLTYHDDDPWRTKYPDGRETIQLAQRWRATLNNRWQLNERSNLLVGASWYRDFAKTTQSDGIFIIDPATYYDGDNEVSYNDRAFYFQLEQNTDLGQFVIGGRYDDHSYAGEKFVPRLAFTKSWDKLHFKAIYNEAFRIPQIDTIQTTRNTGRDLLSETTETFEFELGYQIENQWLVQANLYHINVNDFVAYDPMTFAFQNSGDIRTRGIELTAKWLQPWGSLDVAYSYVNLSENNILSLTVPQDQGSLIGVPADKVSINWRYNINDSSTFSINYNRAGERYGCVNDPDFVCGTPRRFKAENELTTYYKKEWGNWNFGVGVRNLLDEKVEIFQAYTGGYAPITELGRRYHFDIGYRF